MHSFSDPLVQAAADFYVLAIGDGEAEEAVAETGVQLLQALKIVSPLQ